MPEYLSPGVFVEEIPARLKAIEGVSTSTAGFVGPAERGTVAGFPPPFTPTNGFVVPADLAPVLVTSFSDFTRAFGNPLPVPTPTDSQDYGYLAYSVKAFFDNGGKRCFIARVVHTATATRSSLRVGQGVVLRLARPARAGDTTLYFTSIRGVNKGLTLNLFKRSDGTTSVSGGTAGVVGTVAGPFNLAAGDRFGVSVSGGPAVVMTAVAGTPASVQSGAAGPYVLVDGDTLQVRVGPASSPVQSVVFHAADFAAINAATAAEVAALLNDGLTGVQVAAVGGNNVQLRTDAGGTGAGITVVGGSAAAKLGLAGAPVTAGTGNVADLTRVTVAELVALFTPVGFKIADDGAGHLALTSTATGTSASVQVVDTVAGTAAKLGLSTALASGTAPTALTVTAYDTTRNSLTLSAPLGRDLDPNDVYATLSGTGALGVTAGAGPLFFARNPGSWSAGLSVSIGNSDRSPVPVAFGAAGGATSVQVQSSSSFYAGAIIEVDHGGTQGSVRTYHEVADVQGNVLRLSDPLGTAVDPGSVTPGSPPVGSFVRVVEIDVTVTDGSGASPQETFKGLSWNQGPNVDLRKHYATQINGRSRLVYVQPPGVGSPGPLSGSEGADLESQPMTVDGFPAKPLAADVGNDGLPAAGDAGDADYIGIDPGPGRRTGLQSLKDVDDVRIIAAPGKTSTFVQLALINQCELLRYRFAVLDSLPPDQDGSVPGVLAHRSLYDSSFAAYYTPWIGVQNGNRVDFLPPSGYVTGIYARVDNDRGVFKAPANEVVANATALQSYFTTGEQDLLNPRGVNVIRRFEGRGIRVWGARTLSSDPEFRYVNVRRFLIFMEASIDRGTQYVVFEPNSPETWARVVNSVGAFLNTQWRTGALFGTKPDDAYYVRCDETTMTADDVQNGRLICDIGVAIVRPAEFVIFRIEQITGFGASS